MRTYIHVHYIYIYGWMVVRCAFSPPPPMVSPSKYKKYKGLKPRGLENPTTGTPLGPHTKEWNGGLAEEHVRRENAILTQTRGVCACVCVRVCVCMCLRAKGQTILFHRRGVGR